MEEDTPLRRSSRSRSRTPSSLIISQVDGERVQGMREAAIRIEKYQAIREVVIEGHNEITVSSSSTRTVVSNGDTGLNNNSSLEAHQNAINLSQESLKKKKPTKTAEDKSRRTVRLSKKSSTNGGSPSKKKATKSQSDISEPSQEETPLGAPSSSKSQTRSRSTKTSNGSSELTYESYMTTKASPKASPQARRLHENAMSGEYNSENSVFLKFYRNVGEWWNFYKKTDYTYSPLSAQRYEIAPGFYNMPNLSRRAIGSYSSSVSRMQQDFAYNLSREDSDSEEFVDPRRWRYEEQHEHRQFGLFRRIWTTIYSLLVIIYAYTIGVVVTGAVSLVNRIRSFFSARNTRDTRNYYYYKETSTLISDAERTEEAHAWTEKFLLFFAWIYSAITRNWGKLLLLLLLLLLGYSLYTGWCCPMLTNPFEGLTLWQDSVDYVQNTFAWSQDFLKAFYSRTVMLLLEPWLWLTWFLSSLANVIMDLVVAPFRLVIYLFTSLAALLTSWSSAFAMKIQEPVFQSAEMAAALPDQVGQQQATVVAGAVNGFDLNSLNIEELALKVLGTSALKNLQSKQATFSNEIKDHAAVFQKLSGDIVGINSKLDVLSVEVESEGQKQERVQVLTSLDGKIGKLEEEFKAFYPLNVENSNCCDKVKAELGDLSAKIVSLSSTNNDQSEANADLLINLKSQSEATEQLRERVRQLEVALTAAQERNLLTIDEKIKAMALEIAELKQLKVATAATVPAVIDISNDHVAAMIRSQIAMYNADKTDLPDYALESSGGTILTTRCTESYDERNAFTYYFGMEWFYKKTFKPNNPRSIIQPNVNPGECFAFKGANAMILMGLSKKIRVTAVTMEHIPKTIAINGNIDSAPKEFSVWGYSDDLDPEPLLLGNFEYLDNNQSLQTYYINVDHVPFQKVELRIESNHGHMEYTCIYRFRVHGVPA